VQVGPFIGDCMQTDGFRVHIFKSRTAARCDAKAFSHSPKSKPKNPNCFLSPLLNMTGWSAGSPNDVSRDDFEPQPNRQAIDLRQCLAAFSSILCCLDYPHHDTRSLPTTSQGINSARLTGFWRARSDISKSLRPSDNHRAGQGRQVIGHQELVSSNRPSDGTEIVIVVHRRTI
jgi:hypothetical protein